MKRLPPTTTPSRRSLWLDRLTPRTLLMISIGVALGTIGLKGLAWWMTDSVGLLSDAMESFVNLAAAVFGLQMVTIAARPADEDHPYGHNKAEYFSSAFEGALIVLAALGIAWMAINRLLHPQPLESLGWGLILSLVSSACNGLLAWVMFQIAKKHHSIALEADAKHLMTDVWTSAGVLLGLILVQWTGWYALDPLLAIGVALNIVWEGGHLIWRSSQGLMDEAAPSEIRVQIEKTLEQFKQKQIGTVHFDHVITRAAGQRYFADIHMHLPESLSLGAAAEMRYIATQALQQAIPQLTATLVVLPFDETSGAPPFHDKI